MFQYISFKTQITSKSRAAELKGLLPIQWIHKHTCESCSLVCVWKAHHGGVVLCALSLHFLLYSIPGSDTQKTETHSCAHTHIHTQTNRNEWTAWLPVSTSDDITPSHPLPPWPNSLKREWQDFLFYVTTYFKHSFSLGCSFNMSLSINLFCTDRALPLKRTAKCFCLGEYMWVNSNTSPLWWLGSSELCMTWPRSD